MALPPDQRIKFFVFVIESPSPVDLYHRRSEGEIIWQAVNLNQIGCIVKTAVNYEAFEASLKIGLKEAMDLFKGLLPILHISAHGDENGLQMSSGEIIDWANLRVLFKPINEALNKNTTAIFLKPGSYGSDFKIAWKAAIEKKATAKST